ncbi:MAG: molybdopterin cofactor-binding domain-containing protein [Verrucomicrobiota bacterium]
MIAEQSRRDFIENLGKGGAFLLGFSFLPARSLAKAGEEVAASFEPNVFVSIEPSGKVNIVCHFSEMGQRVRTSVGQVIADELEADWKHVNVVQAMGDEKYGSQNTDGSRSIRNNLPRLRKAGATGRVMLEQAAANRWGVDVSECKAELSEVVHAKSGKKIGFGALVADAAKLEVPDQDSLKLKDRKDWRYIGKAVDSVDDAGVVQGTNVFGQDIRLDGMKYAVIARPPVVFGKASSFDASKALAVAGVERVEELPVLEGNAGMKPVGGIAVIAENTWSAIKGRRALEIEWEDGANATYDSEVYRKELEEAVKGPGDVLRSEGDVDAALASSEKRVVRDYYMAHLAHATMEPPAAAATPRGEGVEIWTSTQNPQAIQQNGPGYLGVKQEDIVVNVAFLGGGFGRKSKADFALEAAWLAKKIDGPVKVVWTREDDIRHCYYHSCNAQRFEAGIDKEGKVTALLARSAYPGISSTFNSAAENPGSFELDLGFKDNAFYVPHMRLENPKAKGHVRIGWLRSVCNIFHAFGAQTFADELAAELGRDPKDFLLELIGPDRDIDLTQTKNPYGNYGDTIERHPVNTGRLSHVTREAAKMAGWGRKLPKRRGLGVAAHRSFLTYVATVMEVEVSESGNVKVVGIWTAADAGTIVNLDAVNAQCEGGAIFGISCALGEITAKAGRIQQSNYHDYLVARMAETPITSEVKVIESDAYPAGVGEPATPPAAPAFCNAIFAATGKRIRSLPIGNQLRA